MDLLFNDVLCVIGLFSSQKTEIKKSQQDLLIDTLNQQVKEVTEKIQLTNAHIAAQKAETATARGMSILVELQRVNQLQLISCVCACCDTSLSLSGSQPCWTRRTRRWR